MKVAKALLASLTAKERSLLVGMLAVFIAALLIRVSLLIHTKSEFVAVPGGSYREGVVGQPIAINPVLSQNTTDQELSALTFSELKSFIANLEVSDDSRVYTVKLKENLMWDNGQPLTSDDVVFTIKTAQDQETNSPLKKSWDGVIVERLSELQLKLTLTAPYVFFKNTVERLLVVPEHIFGAIPPANLRLSIYNLKPVGNGPYRFKSFTKRSNGFIASYHLTRNDHFHGNPPFIKDFIVNFYESDEEMLRAFKFRKIDGFGSLVPQVSGGFQAKKVRTHTVPMSRYYAIFFNPNVNPVLKEAGVRKALDAAIDRDAIVREVLHGNAKAMETLTLTFGNNSAPQQKPYELNRAKEMITSLKKEIKLALVVPKVGFLEKVAQAVQQMWLKAGVGEVTLIPLDTGDLFENVIKPNNYEMILFGNILENPEDLFPFWHSSQRFYPGLNLSLYKNQKVDGLIERIRQTKDVAARQSYLKQIQELISEEVPAIFLFALPYTYTNRSDVGGITFDTSIPFVTPAERFQNVANWYVLKARVIR